MSKRGDNIRKRKDGRWEGRYKKGRLPNGNIQYKSVYGKTYREVKEKIETLVKYSETQVLSKGKEKTFAEILNLWITNNKVRLKGGSINKYQNLIDTHISPELGQIKITEIDATQINLFLENKLKNGRVADTGGLSPSYVRSMMLIINAALKYAVSEQYCFPLKSPIFKPAIPKEDFTILSKEEQLRLEANLLKDLNLTNAGIFISLHTGLRIGELCALSWENVDLKNMVIRVRHTIARVKADSADLKCSTTLVIDSPKTKASIRDVPISSVLMRVLIKLQSLSNHGFVLTGCENFLKPRTFEYRYHRTLKNYGITEVNFHALRHTFATRCIEVGVDVKSLSEILGHSNVGVTLKTYVHSSMDLKRIQMEKFAELSVEVL